jgi:DNA-binding MarR family transcriptional regulator
MSAIKARRGAGVNGPSARPRTEPRQPKPANTSAAYRLRMANKTLVRSWERKLQPLGVAEPHYYYLRVLLEEDGITQADLGERLGIEPPAVTGVLDKMAALGLIRRADDKQDRRKRRIFLTKKGATLRLPLLTAMQVRDATLLAGISAADYATFCRVLDRIVENAEHDSAEDLLGSGLV